MEKKGWVQLAQVFDSSFPEEASDAEAIAFLAGYLTAVNNNNVGEAAEVFNSKGDTKMGRFVFGEDGQVIGRINEEADGRTVVYGPNGEFLGWSNDLGTFAGSEGRRATYGRDPGILLNDDDNEEDNDW